MKLNCQKNNGQIQAYFFEERVVWQNGSAAMNLIPATEIDHPEATGKPELIVVEGTREQLERLIEEQLMVEVNRYQHRAKKNGPLTEAEKNHLRQVAESAVKNKLRKQEIGIEKERQRERAESAEEKAMKDGLTGIYNKRWLDEHLDQALSRAERNDTSTAYILVDLDHFKRINDVLKYQNADIVLKKVVDILQSKVREGENLARAGGEEFVIVAENTDLKAAMTLGNRLKRAVEEELFPFMQSTFGDDVVKNLQGTISVGISISDPKNAVENRSSFIDRAESALHKAKKAGRNRVEFVAEDSEVSKTETTFDLEREKEKAKGVLPVDPIERMEVLKALMAEAQAANGTAPEEVHTAVRDVVETLSPEETGALADLSE